MLYGLYLSASGLRAQDGRQSITANNLANAQTVGFKRDYSIIAARANACYEDPAMAGYCHPVLKDQGGGVTMASSGIDLTQAALDKTGRPFDVAVDGEGFLQVQGENAQQTLLTRDGRLAINNQGVLVQASSGKAMLDVNGQTLKVSPNDPLEINGHGEVKQYGTVVGQLALTAVQSPGDLQKVGNGLMALRAGAETQPAEGSKLRQGFTESSGVDPVVEMVNMLEGQRIYEANAKMIQYQDQTLGQLNTVGRIA